MEFTRNMENYDDQETLDDVKSFLCLKENHNLKRDISKASRDSFAGGEILAMPGTDCLRFYYEGKPLGSVKKKKWYRFPSSYKEYVMEQITEEHDLWKPRTDKKVFYFQPQTLKGIKAGIREGLKRDKERKSEQVIALRHQTFLPGDYSICDMEAAIPKGDLKGTTRGEGKQAEIDLIAICPEKKSILLIEYKCQDKAVTGGLEDSLKGWNVRPKNSKGEETAEKKNVAAHFKDYLAALEACGNQDFVRVLIREYNYLAALRNGEPIKAADGSEELPSEELQEYARNIRILFLFTNSPKVGVRWSDNLTENSYRLARKSLIGCRDMYRKELKKCGLDESFLANAEKAICLAAEGPENVILREELFTSVEDLKFPSDSVVRK